MLKLIGNEREPQTTCSGDELVQQKIGYTILGQPHKFQ